jgi:hypothetical protein
MEPTNGIDIDIGIDAGKRADIAKGLARVLADSHTLWRSRAAA